MILRVVVAEDMPLARHRLCRLLSADPQVVIIGEAADGRTAVRVIEQQRPDAVFLDIQMPELDGFGVLGALGPGVAPAAVFVTAYDEFALRAFEVYAVDYLLKPVTPERVERTLARVRQRLQARQPVATTPTGSSYTQRFVVKHAGRTVIVPVADLWCVQSEGNYVRLCVEERSWLMRESLSSVAAQLDPAAFIRIHRSSIVALSRVTTVAPIVNGDQLVTLSNGMALTMSRTYRRAFIDRLTGDVA